jgi:hypothetical protein
MHEPIDLSEEGNLELTIRFNNVKYRSWKDARDAFHKLKNRKAKDSVWSRLKAASTLLVRWIQSDFNPEARHSVSGHVIQMLP